MEVTEVIKDKTSTKQGVRGTKNGATTMLKFKNLWEYHEIFN